MMLLEQMCHGYDKMLALGPTHTLKCLRTLNY